MTYILDVFLQLPGLFIVQCAIKAQVLTERALQLVQNKHAVMK